MSLQTPRILPAHLHAFHASSGPNSRTPRQVRVLGTISELRGETATITCGHHGEIMLRLNPDSHLQMGRMVEIIGKVVEVEPQRLGIAVLGATDWGNPNDIDYKMWEQTVEVTHQFKEIFYSLD